MKDRLTDLAIVGLERPLVVCAMVLGSVLLVSLARAHQRLDRILSTLPAGRPLGPPSASEAVRDV